MGLKISGTKSTAWRNHTAFIVLFRITSSEEGAACAGYSCFYYLKIYYFKSHIAGKWLSFYPEFRHLTIISIEEA